MPSLTGNSEESNLIRLYWGDGLTRISHTGVVKTRSGSREKRGDEEEAGLNTLRPTSNAAFPSKNKQIRGSQCEICGFTSKIWNLFRVSGFEFRIFFPAFALFLTLVSSALAQQGEPHIGYVYPAGGQRGTTFQVVVGGQTFEGAVTGIRITGTGIEATLGDQSKRITPMEAKQLRTRLMELNNMKPLDAAATKEVADIKSKLAIFERKRVNPALADNVVLQVTIAPDAPVGTREFRLQTESGFSNPLAFNVGVLPEFTKDKPNDDQAVLRQAKNNDQKAVAATDATITLPVIVNGQILQGGVDRYHFHAFAGEHLIVAVSARELIPYLADAVPGWFQTTVSLYDGKGNEVTYDDRYEFHPDPVLAYTIPSADDYVLEIHDSLYRGRDDFVYRVAIGQLPFLSGVFPLGGRAGTQPSIELRGWNLPSPVKLVNLKGATPGSEPVWTRDFGYISDLSFAVDDLPECVENGKNHSPSTAQPVTLPIIINGRIGKPGDSEVYRFEGHAGQKIVAEVNARRLGSPLDSVLKLTDTNGKQLAFNDDFDDKGAGLETHHADSYLTDTLPADGTYFISIGDAQSKGGWDYAYRLRLSEPRPDFALRVVPSGINVRAGTNIPITVYAFRRDGFTGEIKLELKDAPNGLKLTGDKVAAKQDQARFTLTAPATEMVEPFDLQMVGRAVIEGREVVHPVLPADDMMQAFAYHHIVPAQELLTKVTRRPPPRPPMRIVTALPLKIPVGGIARLRVNVQIPAAMSLLQFDLNQPPEGVTIQSITPVEGGDMEIMLQSDATKTQAAKTGNLIINASAMRPPEVANGKAASRRVPLGALPAVAYEMDATQAQMEGSTPSVPSK